MKFTIAKETLLNHLNYVIKAVPTKTAYPILTSIKVEVYQTKIVLTATDIDVAIQTVIDGSQVKIEQTGKAALNAKLFVDIIRTSNAVYVDFFLAEERLLIIKSDRAEFKLKLQDVDDYPEVDFLEDEHPISLSNSFFKSLIRETAFAASNSDVKPILTGVHLKYEDGLLKAEATDSYRLSQKKVEVNIGKKNFSIVVPKSALEEIAKILDVISCDVKMHVSAHKLLLTFDKILFQTRLIEGNYPDFGRIIPTEFSTIVTFNREELLRGVERVSLLSPKDREINYNYIKFLLGSDQTVELSSKNSSVGDSLEIINPSEDPVGSGISSAFSAKYLIDALKTFSSNEITLSFSSDVRPFIITDQTDSGLIQLILPVRI